MSNTATSSDVAKVLSRTTPDETYASIIEQIKSRRSKLQSVGQDLKKHFVGIDNIIDEILKNLEVWYVMPDVISRPVIINLWGMTGVGKTDLVRQLVRGLGFSDKFLEIQLCNNGSSTSYHTTISSAMAGSNLETKVEGILLLDEIQRFRTVDEENKEIPDYKFQDLWMLLSDGRFSGSTGKEEIMSILFENVLYGPVHKSLSDNNVQTEESEKQNKYRRSYYSARKMKKTLRLNECVEEIMMWDDDKKMKMALSRLESQETFEGDDYSKLLIFISGNLDEAYKMASDVAENSIDADVLHAFSLKINFLRIKQALRHRFKPEQIARFGNTHIIYPSLSKASYQEIARRKMKNIAERVEAKHGVEIAFDRSVYDFVYRNGVFPTQGTRPLFSTISSYVENAIPVIALAAIENNVTQVMVSWSEGEFYSNVNGDDVRIKAEGVVDLIKADNDPNQVVKTSVHEAGHAILYAILMEMSPTQIASSITSAIDASGFIGSHAVNHTRKTILDMICMLLGGAVAEEMIFGKINLSSGCCSDLSQATTIASNAVRQWGMYGNISVISDPTWATGHSSNNNNSTVINDQIERIVAEERFRAKEILIKHLPLFKQTSDILIRSGKIMPDDFRMICHKHGVEIVVVDPKKLIYQNYTGLYQNFFAEVEV